MLEPGTTFAGYVVERALGAGGMGEVYVARHPRLPRSDAIKVLGAQVSGDGQFRARFHREAELAAGLSHPAIVQVYDQGEDDGRLWISMQLIDGTDVGKLAAHGPIAVPEVARIISTVADALDFAGARGLVHRDVKPANILISAAGHVMLTDFGIARLSAEASDLTGTGMTVGTLNYASSEQLQGEMVDTRSDQYSLAATAYHLLAGSPPFADSNAVKVITGHLSAPVPPLGARRPGVPAAVDEVLARGLAKDPAQRFATSREFATALQTALLAPHSDVTLQARNSPQTISAQVPSGPPAPASTVHTKGPDDWKPATPPAQTRGNAWTSAAVLGFAALASVVDVYYLNWDFKPTSHQFGIGVYSCAFLIVAAYLFTSSRTVERRPLVIGLLIASWGLICLSRMGIGGGEEQASIVMLRNNAGNLFLATAPAVVLAPLAWGLARRHGSRWMWSLALAPILWIAGSRLASDLELRDGDSLLFGWLIDWLNGNFRAVLGLDARVLNVPFAFALPALVVGLLGWGIDALAHRHEQVHPASRAVSRNHPAGATQANVHPGEGGAPVTVAGAKPESGAAYVTGAVLIALWWIAVLVCATVEQTGIAIFLGLLGVFFTAAFVRVLLRTTSAIGREQATADQHGIRTPRFSYRWHEVLACDFVEQSVTYNGLNSRKTTATREPRTSLIVTLRETDTNGRPVQHGYTLTRHHTDNTAQLLRAAQHFAPDIQIRAELNVDDYASSPRSAAAQQLARDHRIEVRDHRGRAKITLTNNAITADAATIPLSQLTAVVAVTDVFTNSTYGWKTSERIQRLVLVSNDVAADGTPNTVRIDYPGKFNPPLEQFLAALRSLAPHIDVRDRRTVT
ncbi:serine/threonine-protein kinase [Tsukamurella tyrosinosolvens]|uniref:serine/threonine-protein kinase n=1 Tax=Tsukamurella tyrosinosolvens TaxID=57704 RepID=UPI002DD423A4|nr:serine/threonine-protein kinase [Tsukamurella tyrosinosolvens]MEC4615714.1 serine/threonine-protein kinase [Tsukamurella tyrosinosolvens]